MSPKQGARLVVRRSSFGHPKCALTAFIAGHPLNHAVNLILPHTTGKDEVLKQVHTTETTSKPVDGHSISDTERADVSHTTHQTSHGTGFDNTLDASLERIASRGYSLIRCSLACLVEHDFVERHIRAEAASFCALSVSNPAGSGDSTAILPDGKLHLAVSEGTYQRLGLQGAHVSHNTGRYHIEVDLYGRSYEQGAPFYTKVMARLRDHTGPVDFLCIKSIDGAAADMQFPGGAEVLYTSQRRPDFSTAGISSALPALLSSLTYSEIGQAKTRDFALSVATTDDLLVIHEWLGGISCGIAGDEVLDANAEASIPDDHITRHTFTGLLSSCSVVDAVHAARQQVDKDSCAWAAVHVWGFQDAPVSWHGAMHGHGPMLGGENDYTVLLLPGGQYVLYVAAGEGDHFSSIGAPENT